MGLSTWWRDETTPSPDVSASKRPSASPEDFVHVYADTGRGAASAGTFTRVMLARGTNPPRGVDCDRPVGEAKPAGRTAQHRLARAHGGTGAWVEGALTSGSGIGAICRPLTDGLRSVVEAGSGVRAFTTLHRAA